VRVGPASTRGSGSCGLKPSIGMGNEDTSACATTSQITGSAGPFPNGSRARRGRVFQPWSSFRAVACRAAARPLTFASTNTFSITKCAGSSLLP